MHTNHKLVQTVSFSPRGATIGPIRDGDMNGKSTRAEEFNGASMKIMQPCQHVSLYDFRTCTNEFPGSSKYPRHRDHASSHYRSDFSHFWQMYV